MQSGDSGLLFGPIHIYAQIRRGYAGFLGKLQGKEAADLLPGLSCGKLLQSGTVGLRHGDLMGGIILEKRPIKFLEGGDDEENADQGGQIADVFFQSRPRYGGADSSQQRAAKQNGEVLLQG